MSVKKDWADHAAEACWHSIEHVLPDTMRADNYKAVILSTWAQRIREHERADAHTATGGIVPQPSDTVPAWISPGSVVPIKGYSNETLKKLNAGAIELTAEQVQELLKKTQERKMEKTDAPTIDWKSLQRPSEPYDPKNP